MKSIALTTVALLSAIAAAGCQTAPKPTPAPEPTLSPAETLERLKAAYAIAIPDAQLASVTDVLEGESYVAVAPIAGDAFSVGAVISIVDLDQKVIAHGKVVRVIGDTAHATYTVVARAPRVGDVAVKF